MKKKIVLIGAGSAMFTQGLVYDLIEQKSEIKWQLALVDIDKKALESIRLLCEKMIKTRNSDVELTYSTDRRDVLKGADFVVSTIGVGGRRAWEQDVFIPRKYGIYQPVGDSVAPGGISRAMRMIPALIDIVRDVMELCPNAYFFNYANPMTTICRAIRKETGFPVIGLCHGVKNGQKRISRFTGMELDKVTALAVGVNHFVIMYDLRYEGKDAWQKVKDAMEKNDGSDVNAPVKLGPLSREFIKRYNAYPVSDDRHYSEFVGETLHKNTYYGRTLGIDDYSFEKTISWGDDIYDQTVSLAYSDQPLPDDYFKKFEGEHEQLMEIIQSILQDKRGIYSVNMPNEGTVPELPPYSVIEMSAVAAGRGFMPLKVSNFSPVFAGMLTRHLAIAEITVEAALKGDRNLFTEAVLLGGYITDKAAASSMVDELIRAQSKYLPQYK